MRVAFFGTPDISGTYLEALAECHEVVGVVTQPDRPRGRSGQCCPPPTKELAARRGIPVLQPDKGQCARACECLQENRPDICVVVAFGQKLPCGACSCMVGRSINVHYSLLPQLRGPAPVQHAILQGLEVTGVTIQHIAPGIDEGDIIARRSLEIDPQDTTRSLTERLTALGVPLLLETLAAMEGGTATREPQDHSRATHAPLIRKQDGLINWDEPADLIARRVRAFYPWPTAYTRLDKRAVRILRAEPLSDAGGEEGEPGEVVELDKSAPLAVKCGQGYLCLEEVQVEGKKPMVVADWLRGARVTPGMKFG